MINLPATVAEFNDWWVDDQRPVTERRTFLELVFERIEVTPVRLLGYKYFDPERLRPVWRA